MDPNLNLNLSVNGECNPSCFTFPQTTLPPSIQPPPPPTNHGFLSIQRRGAGAHDPSHREEAGVWKWYTPQVRINIQMADFMRLYSGLVERCFNACTQDFTSKTLTKNEVGLSLHPRNTSYIVSGRGGSKIERHRSQIHDFFAPSLSFSSAYSFTESLCPELRGQVLKTF